MNYEPETVKGFQDYLPPESLKRAAVKKIVEKNFQLYGFLPIETPVVEYDSLMRPDNLPTEEVDEAVSSRFRMQDRGGRSIGLRYEFTFQLARIFRQNPNLKLPFKRYQIGEVFRDEPISARRFRQFMQCDADIIGEPSAAADAECIALFSDILKELKIDAEIEINNRKLLAAIIESVEIRQVNNVMKELDKIDKIGEDEVKANLKRYTSANQVVTLFKLLEKSVEFFKENAFAGVEEIEALMNKCRLYGVKVKFNPFLARGLGYYTGNIFEIVSNFEGRKISIAGGGRYDKSVGKFVFKEIPAVGISFGLERISEVASVSPAALPKVLVISISQDKESLKISKALRKEDISCSVSFDKIGKALEYANSYSIPFVVFVGAEEVSAKKFKLRNMVSGEEKLLNEKQLIKILGKD